MRVRVIKIIPDTVVDGPHYRCSIYLSGCYHNCKGCHNPQSWDYKSGKDMSIDEVVDEVIKSGHKYVTLSGGDPFCYQDFECSMLCDKLREKIPDINIWAYTGFTMEELLAKDSKLLTKLDGLVDGKFDEKLKSTNCKWRGSTNQRIFEKINGIWSLSVDN